MNLKRMVWLIWRNKHSLNRPIEATISRMKNIPLEKRVIIPDGQEMTVVLPDIPSNHLYLNIPYETDVIAFMDKALMPGMTFFDIGAHMGYHTLLARNRVGESGKVVSFEPIDETYKILELNCGQYPNVTLEKMAVADGSSPEVLLKYYGIRFASQSTATNPRLPKHLHKLPKPQLRYAQAVSIDHYVQESSDVPDFIKIDIEGGEMDALRGAEDTISHYRPPITIEVGDFGRVERNSSISCIRFLEKLGYGFFEHNGNGIMPHKPKDVYVGDNNILCSPV